MKNKSLFSNDDTRNMFIDNVMELESFIDLRIQDKMDSENAMNSVVDGEIFSTAPKILQNESMDQLKRYQAAVKDAVNVLNNARLKQLLLIITSNKYRKRLARSLFQRIEIIDKLQDNLRSVEQKRKQQIWMIESKMSEIDRLISETIEIQRFLEQQISKQIAHRPVHIFREINALT